MAAYNYDTFREWLADEMKRRGWSYTELSQRTGITLSHLSRVSQGERIPGMKTITAIARAFHRPAEEVLRLAGVIPPARGSVEGAEEMQAYFAELSPEDRKRLLTIARAFLAEQTED